MSKVSHSVVERFKKTGIAKDLEQDTREWVLLSWPWLPDAPYTVIARASDGEERQFVGDAEGLWVARSLRAPTAAATA
jgi:hypothetical protein